MRATAPGAPVPHSPAATSPVALGPTESWSTPTTSPTFLDGTPEQETISSSTVSIVNQLTGHSAAGLNLEEEVVPLSPTPSSPWSQIRREEAEGAPTPPTVVVLCAHEEEARHFRGWLSGPLVQESTVGGLWRRSSGTLKGVALRVDLVVCGAGAANAAAAAAVCCANGSKGSPVALFACGRALAHSAELQPGDVVVGTATVGLDIEGHDSELGAAWRSPAPHAVASPASYGSFRDEFASPEAARTQSAAAVREQAVPVRRVEADSGLLAAARVAVAAQRGGMILEGPIGSTEAWPSPRLPELLERRHDDRVFATDGESHAAAVICRQWEVRYLSVKEAASTEVLSTSLGRQAAGGRSAELIVRILRILLPETQQLTPRQISSDPLTPPVAASTVEVIKPSPLRFEGEARRTSPPPPDASPAELSDRSHSGSAEQHGSAWNSKEPPRSRPRSPTWGAWGPGAGGGCGALVASVVALALGCGIGWYVALATTVSA